MAYIQQVTVDITPGNNKKTPIFNASQYDKGREFRANLVSDLVPYVLDGTEVISLAVRKCDNTLVAADIANTFSGKSYIDFASTEQMCACAGIGNFGEITIAKGDTKIGTLNFVLAVEPSPTEGGIESASEISNLESQVSAMVDEQIEDDLSHYYPKTEADEKFATNADLQTLSGVVDGKANTTDVNNALAQKMNKNNPTGTGSIAVGTGVGANGTTSQAFGYNTTASGTASTALGNTTTASGNQSTSEGNRTVASGDSAHASGRYTISNHRSQNVFGEWNEEDNSSSSATMRGNYIEIVGNGTSESNRSNARTLDWSGNETLAGDLTFNRNKSLTSEISRLDGKIDNLPAPMIFKGTLGVGGTIQALPTASTSNEGFTYKVITDGTYAGQTAKVGDVFTSNGSAWVYIPSGDEDNDTWRAIKVNGVEKLGNGISSGAVDFVGSDNIEVDFDGNGNKVGIKTKNIYTQEQVDAIVSDAIYNILPDDTASGSVANFTTSLELPIKSLEVDVNAVQESGTPTPSSPKAISGWSEIGIVKEAINLWDEETRIGGYKISDGTFDVTLTGRLCTLNFIRVKPNTSVYWLALAGSTTGNIFYYDKDKNYISGETGRGNSVINIPNNCHYLNFTLPTAYGTTYHNDVSLNSDSTDITYHAYNGTTEVINLGGTYYGGHFTQDKDGHRQFEVTHGFDSFDLSTILPSSTIEGFDRWALSLSSTSTAGGQSANKKCNMTSTYAYSTSAIEHFYIANASVRFYFEENTVRNKIIEFLYPLATSYVIDLPDGEPINTLAGVNNFFADTGDTEVVFKCSVNDYVSAHSGGNLLGMGGVYLGGAKSGGSEEETDNTEDTEKTKLDEPKEEIKTIGDTKKLGGE